jgi:hypothetical protein
MIQTHTLRPACQPPGGTPVFRCLVFGLLTKSKPAGSRWRALMFQGRGRRRASASRLLNGTGFGSGTFPVPVQGLQVSGDWIGSPNTAGRITTRQPRPSQFGHFILLPPNQPLLAAWRGPLANTGRDALGYSNSRSAIRYCCFERAACAYRLSASRHSHLWRRLARDRELPPSC